MSSVFDRDDITFQVVVNHEEQYSIWPDYKEIPAGWRPAGKSGLKQECLDYVDEVWTDMRPLSLRQAMAQQGAQPTLQAQPQDRDGQVPAQETLSNGN